MTQGLRTLVLVLIPALFLIGAFLFLQGTDEYGNRESDVRILLPVSEAADAPVRSREAPAVPAPSTGEIRERRTVAPAAFPRPDRVIGSVHRRDGTPVGGALIEAVCHARVFFGSTKDGLIEDESGRQALAAGADGTFAFEAAADRFYSLYVSAPGLGRRRILRALPGRPLDIVLDEPVTVAGVIEEDGTGHPVAEAEVRLTDEIGEVVAISAVDGSFRIEGMLPGGIVLEALHARYQPVVQRIELPVGQETCCTVRVTRGAGLVATAVDRETRVAMTDATFRVTDRLSGLELVRDTAAPNGRLTYGGLVPGRDYVVSARRPHSGTAYGVVRAVVNTDSAIELELDSSWTLYGVVRTTAGMPLAASYLIVEGTGIINAPAGGNEVYRIFSAADGSYAVPGLNPSLTYTITAYHQTASVRVIPGVSRASYGMGAFDILLSSPSIVQGSVVDSAGQVVPGALVILESTSVAGNTGGRMFTWTDAQGQYVFVNAPTGTFSIVVVEPQLGVTASPVESATSEAPSHVELQFDVPLPD